MTQEFQLEQTKLDCLRKEVCIFLGHLAFNLHLEVLFRVNVHLSASEQTFSYLWC